MPHYRAEILTIFGSYFGRNDDFINFFWNLMTFINASKKAKQSISFWNSEMPDSDAKKAISWIAKKNVGRGQHLKYFSKGQLISESICEVIVSTKIWTKNCKAFCPVVWHSTGQKSLQFMSVNLSDKILSFVLYCNDYI